MTDLDGAAATDAHVRALRFALSVLRGDLDTTCEPALPVMAVLADLALGAMAKCSLAERHLTPQQILAYRADRRTREAFTGQVRAELEAVLADVMLSSVTGTAET